MEECLLFWGKQEEGRAYSMKMEKGKLCFHVWGPVSSVPSLTALPHTLRTQEGSDKVGALPQRWRPSYLNATYSQYRWPGTQGGFIPASSWSEAFCIKKLKKIFYNFIYLLWQLLDQETQAPHSSIFKMQLPPHGPRWLLLPLPSGQHTS